MARVLIFFSFALASRILVAQEPRIPEGPPPPELVGRWMEKTPDHKGDFVGYYCDQSSFVFGYEGKSSKFKKDVTLSGNHIVTAPSGINASGMIVGWSVDFTANTQGFVLKGGTASFVSYPGAAQTQLEVHRRRLVAAGWRARWRLRTGRAGRGAA